MGSRTRRRRLRAKAKKQREIVFPTQERMAKGNVVRLPNGQMKCVIPTFYDVIIQQDVFYDEPDRDDLYLALAFMLDLTERSGLFTSATRSISELSFVKGLSNDDVSAADDWRHILNSLNSDAYVTMVDLLSDTRPRDPAFLQSKVSCFRELSRCVGVFRFNQKSLTKAKN